MTQREALNILKTGRNVFLTGAAGSGKTYVLKQYIEYLKEINAVFGITASTGIAATHMGGVTIHSWSGIGVKDYLNKNDVIEIAETSRIKKVVANASVLIIDEISMLHHFRLDLIDLVLRQIKNLNEPFGGIQVVFCGDFFQLPPVHRSGEREAFFAYHSEAWKNLNLKVCYLSEQHRQNDDQFVSILNSIRNNNIDDGVYELLQDRFGKKPEFEATKLYTHNKNVDEENGFELSKIGGRSCEYEMLEKGRKSLVETLKKSCLAPETLKLKVGAKVMFVKNNFEKGYVNGTLGTVIKCGVENIEVKTLSGNVIEVERESWALEEDGRVRAEISQYPLRLAWAITIHKSQGMSLDAAQVDLSRSFERGMGYVALSRVRSLEGLYLSGMNNMALLVNEEVLDMDKKFQRLSETNSFHIRTMGDTKLFDMHQDFKKKIERESGPKKINTVEQTKIMIDQGLSIKDIAKKRGLKAGTIFDHIEEIKESDPTFRLYHLKNAIPNSKFKNIYGAFKKVGIIDGAYRLGPVKEMLGSKYSYDDLRLVRLFL